MRLFILLATAVLLAACVHEKDDFQLFLAEEGVSLTYYIGSEANTIQKSDDDDPWDTINTKFGTETVHTGKVKSAGGGADDPWDTISEKFDIDSNHRAETEKNDANDDPWDTITEKFGRDTTHTGKKKKGKSPWTRVKELFGLGTIDSNKTDERRFFGVEKSSAVFVSFTGEQPNSFRAVVTEVRGNILALEFTDGAVQYVVDAPASWTEGTQLETGFVDAVSKEDRPFLGVRFWRTVQGSSWGERSGVPVAELPVPWPIDNGASGASLLVSVSVQGKTNTDPWDTIQENFSSEGSKGNDPWDTIRTKFDVDSTHTGKKKGRFRGRSISSTSFVVVQDGRVRGTGHRGGDDSGVKDIASEREVLLKVIEVRGTASRFEFVDAAGEALGNHCTLFAVGAPAGWVPGTVLKSDVLLLGSEITLPVMGAVVWEVEAKV